MKIIKSLIWLLTAQLLMASAYAGSLPGPLVDTDWLAKNSKSVLILDVRKDTKSFAAKPVWKTDKKTKKKKLLKVAGHIPGASLVDYGKLRAKVSIGGKTVQKMLPGKSAFEKFMQSVGVNKNSTIVIVSKGNNNGDMTMATRLYWQLKYYGHDDMAILNGGMGQWILDDEKLPKVKAK